MALPESGSARTLSTLNGGFVPGGEVVALNWLTGRHNTLSAVTAANGFSPIFRRRRLLLLLLPLLLPVHERHLLRRVRSSRNSVFGFWN